MGIRFRGAMLLLSLAVTAACTAFDPEAGRPPPGKTNVIKGRFDGGWSPSLDLLFVVDNSPSMASKQALAFAKIKKTVERLTLPRCVSDEGKWIEGEQSCPEGFRREFRAFGNINIGVISTSLGGQGASVCGDAQPGHQNDRAHLIGKVREGAPDPTGFGFLTWRRGNAEDRQELLADLTAQLEAVGSDGCPFSASLEAWYRFLVDPSPPLDIVLNEWGHSEPARESDGKIRVDTELLAQREEFLRPQGLVAIVNVTDDDDCSAMAGGTGYEADSLGRLALGHEVVLHRPTSICAENENDACCVSCLNPEVAPAHCDLSECEGDALLSREEDPPQLRCFDQRRRFGRNFLYPLERYSHGLRSGTVRDGQSGEQVDNPLFRRAGRNAGISRFEFNVLVSGMLGVPWQDLVTQDSLHDPEVFEYLDEWELQRPDFGGSPEVSPWEVMLGHPGIPARSPECAEGARVAVLRRSHPSIRS
jgi:hypothetical protein